MLLIHNISRISSHVFQMEVRDLPFVVEKEVVRRKVRAISEFHCAVKVSGRCQL